MLNVFIDVFKKLENNIKKIMIYGFKFSFSIAILSAIILLTYELYSISIIFYYSGIILFKTSLMFAVEFIICGLIVDSIKKQIIWQSFFIFVILFLHILFF